MPKFYFTYGTEGQPFVGGWTEVEAPDGHAACAAFRACHPDKTEGLSMRNFHLCLPCINQKTLKTHS